MYFQAGVPYHRQYFASTGKKEKGMKERKKVFLKRKLSGAPEEKNVVYFFNTHDDVYRNRTRLRCVSGAVIKEEKKLYKYDEYKNESIQHKREARRK